MSKLFKLFLAGLWFFSLGLSLGEKVVTVKVDKKNVETGEIFTYEVAVQGNLKSSAKLRLPKFKGLSVISQSQSRNYSRKSGETKTTINFTYYIFAPNPGVYIIEPVTLENGEGKIMSRSITIKAAGKPLEEKKKILPYIEKGTSL